MAQGMYKSTDPNGKISLGQDRTAILEYVGDPNSHRIAPDFPRAHRRDCISRTDLLREFSEATAATAQRASTRHNVTRIGAYQAHDPAKGDKRSPKSSG
jgi:hypothetical protein